MAEARFQAANPLLPSQDAPVSVGYCRNQRKQDQRSRSWHGIWAVALVVAVLSFVGCSAVGYGIGSQWEQDRLVDVELLDDVP